MRNRNKIYQIFYIHSIPFLGRLTWLLRDEILEPKFGDFHLLMWKNVSTKFKPKIRINVFIMTDKNSSTWQLVDLQLLDREKSFTWNCVVFYLYMRTNTNVSEKEEGKCPRMGNQIHSQYQVIFNLCIGLIAISSKKREWKYPRNRNKIYQIFYIISLLFLG